jgi:hypothetical protein
MHNLDLISIRLPVTSPWAGWSPKISSPWSPLVLLPAFVETILHRLGATPEQIDRERNRARSELVGESLPAA